MIDSHHKESLQRGTVFFPIQYSLCRTASPLYNLPVHWHVEYEMIHVLEGIYPAFIDDREIELKPGEVCFIRDGMMHGDGKIKTGAEYESVVFDINLLRNQNYAYDHFLADIVDKRVNVNNVISLEDKKLETVTNMLYRAMREEYDGFELVTISSLLMFFGLVQYNHLYTVQADMNTRTMARTARLKAVLEMIHTDYAKQISLDQMAETAGMSPKYFCRIFHEMTLRTPMEYLNAYRIDQACSRIRNSDAQLIDIAYNCGFNDFSYFIKTFKKYKGLTPHKYRTAG